MIGAYEEKLIEFWGKDIFEEFQNFMYGQTYTQISGKNFYYQIDIQHFCGRMGISYPLNIIEIVLQEK